MLLSCVQISEISIQRSIIVACDEEHKKVFPGIPVTSFKSNKNLKLYLVKTVLPDIHEVGISEPCGRNRPPCQQHKKYKYLQK